VRIVELSNHPRMMLQTASRRRLAGERARAQYENALTQHRMRVDEARRARDEARAQRRWLAWLRSALAVRRERRAAPGPVVATGRVSDEEEILRAGIEGEGMVTAALGRVLGDDWTLLRGYRNRRGEIDHLLLGPQGLVAIEVKYLNRIVHCDGDEWWSDKYDNYGNLVESGKKIADDGGRSPSMQLNEPASLLAGFLSSRGHPVPVQRVVLLTHPRSKVGRCSNLTVHVATSAGYVINLLSGLPPTLDAAQLAQLERLIVRDHRFHERPGARPRPSRNPPSP
jgi:hypothetical protein